MAMVERRSEISWEGSVARGDGNLSLATSGAGGDLPVSLPTRAGEAKGQTSPEELIAASHAGCYVMSLAAALGQAGFEPGRLHVTATVGLDRDEGGFRISSSKLVARGEAEGIDDARFAELAQEAEQSCPISNAIRGNVEIELDAALS